MIVVKWTANGLPTVDCVGDGYEGQLRSPGPAKDWAQALATAQVMQGHDYSTKDVPSSYSQVRRLTLRVDGTYVIARLGLHRSGAVDVVEQREGRWSILDATTLHLI